MKTLFCRMFCAAVCAAPVSFAFSLYDTAPVVGVPESQSASYFGSVNVGYDTNPQGTPYRNQREAGEYLNLSATTTFADVESVDKLSYSARLGATRYFGSSVNDKKYYGDCGADVTLVHAFSALSQYTGRLNLSYSPEPGYDNGISAQGRTGDAFTWGWDNMYSEAIDTRWSWNASANYSGTRYTDNANSTYSDNRQYLRSSLGVNYRESDAMTYTWSGSYREEWREVGSDSRSLFATAGFKRSLDLVSSVSLSGGVQKKFISGGGRLSPTVDFGYRRRVSDGFSVNAYVKYSDENVDSFNSYYSATYRSCGTWRAGAYGTYVLSPDVSFVFRVQAMRTEYKKSSKPGSLSARKQTINPAVSMKYNFTANIQGDLTCEYTYYTYHRAEDAMYTRWKVGTGLTYRF